MIPRSLMRSTAWGMARELLGTYLNSGGLDGDNPAGPQCTNVPNTYWGAFGVPPIYGDAFQWVGFQDAWREWVPRRWWRRMRVGDVPVFGESLLAPRGHVDLVLDGTKQPYAGLDQNWPLGSPVSVVRHMKGDVAGWVRLRGE